MLSWILLFLTGLVVGWLVLINKRSIKYKGRTPYDGNFMTHTDLMAWIYSQRAIADLSNFRSARTLDTKQRLTIRSEANARLASVFGIENSFTTTDPYVHGIFQRRAIEVIQKSPRDGSFRVLWDYANGSLLPAIRYHFSRKALRDCKVGLELAPMVRVASFAMVCVLLFPGIGLQQGDLDMELVVVITKEINRLWIESKESLSTLTRDASRLHEALGRLLPKIHSPLNIIMPAYETLWRVVLLTYVQTCLRGQSNEMKQVLDNLATAVVNSLDKTELDNPICEFSKEALRLFPPTKSIYRTTDPTVKAHIVALHHSEQIWPKPRKFLASRFADRTTHTEAQRLAFMPFGIGRHICPAHGGFGERMIAFMVVVLVKNLGSKCSGRGVRFHDAVLDRDDEIQLPSGRGDMEGWRLVMTSAV